MTCRDWFQLTLKEGLTVFRDQHFSEDMTSRAAKRIEDIRIIRSAQFTQDASPMRHPIRPESYVKMDNFYTVTVYNKGAEVIRMYKTLLGAELFRKGMDLYFDRHDGQAVTCDDFRSAMAKASGKDLTQFEQWYLQAGTPRVTVESRGVVDGKYSITMSQANNNLPPLHIPIVAALVSPQGAMTETLFELTDARQTFFFDAPATKECVPSLLRGFSAPVKLGYNPALTVDELQILAANDDDPYVRWDAWQQLATNVVFAKYEHDEPGVPEYLVRAFKATLADHTAEASLRAYSLALPDFSSLAIQLDAVDPDRLCDAIQSTRLGLAMAATTELRKCYESIKTSTTFSIDAADVGGRRLRSTCLSYLAKLDDDAELCERHFDAATCMSDSLAAVSMLASMPDSTSRDRCLQAFYNNAKSNNEALLLNKWFMVQAIADRPDALHIVKRLLVHPDFTQNNPNRFRSLVNAFASANPRHFHAADGSGYDFVADQILQVDSKNPQVAARLCTTLGSWRGYEPTRASLMKRALEKIYNTTELSSDTLEIASRSLA